MPQTHAIFGLSGIGFLDPVAEKAIGFSATATTLKISGGFEAKMQKSSAGLHIASFYQVADATVEIEGITDATIGLMSRLMGGTLVAGSDALPAAARASGLRPDKWAGTTVAAAANQTPEPGFYTIEQTGANAYEVRQLFSSTGFAGVGGEGADVTAMFAISTVPATVDDDDVAGFFWEPVATSEVGEYVYGSLNLPDVVSIFAVTEANKTAERDNRNGARIYVPRVVLNPIEDTHTAGELHALGTVGGMAQHDADIGGTHTIAYTFGAA